MNDPDIPGAILENLLTEGPVLLTGLTGLIVAVLFWRKAPNASLWAAAAFALAIFDCALNAVGQPALSFMAVKVLVPVLRAATYVLLLIGLYAGRANPSAAVPRPQASIWQHVSASIRAYPSLRNVFVPVFVFVFLAVFIMSALTAFLLPESYLSTVRIKLETNSTNAVGTTVPQAASAVARPSPVRTEVEVIQSEVVLARVIKDLDLNGEWGKKYGANLKTAEALGLLKRRINVRPVPDTSVIEIRSFSERPDEAAKVANAIAEDYRDYLREKRTESVSSGGTVEILERAVPAYRPARPNKPALLGVGALIGLWLAFVAAAGLSWVAFRFGRKQPA